jgi:uncharacterized protein (DUF2235 family)
MDYLLVLIVEAVEAVDARHERRRLARRHRAEGDRPKLQEIRRLYEEAKGAWTGCDWHTHFGKLGLDLNGWTPARARARAAECMETEAAAEWRAAGKWLSAVERMAMRAEGHAGWAVRAAAAGAWCEAVEQVRLARACEFATGRLVWRGFPMTWHRFFLAIADAAPDNGEVTTLDLCPNP